MSHETTDQQAPDGQRSLGELIGSITNQFSRLIRGEIELAKANLAGKFLSLGIGGALLAVAGVLGLYLFGVLLFALAFGLASFMPLWAAFLVVAALLLLVMVGLVIAGVSALKRSKQFEVDPKGGIKKSVEAAKMGLKK